MRELLFASKSVQAEEGKAHQFDYYIVVEDILRERELFCENYGVKIASAPDGENCMEVLNITLSFQRIQELAKLLSENIVTPVSLPDVLEDWLS